MIPVTPDVLNTVLVLFVRAVINQRVDIDAAAGNQCVDLAKLYAALLRIFGADPVTAQGRARFGRRLFGNACKLAPVFLKYMPSLKEFVVNDIQRGDIVFWKGHVYSTYKDKDGKTITKIAQRGIGVYGHVAVALAKPVGGYVKVIEQNGGAKTLNPPCNIGTLSLKYFQTALRPTEVNPNLAMVAGGKLNLDADNYPDDGNTKMPSLDEVMRPYSVSDTDSKTYKVKADDTTCWKLSFTTWPQEQDKPDYTASTEQAGYIFTSSHKALHQLGGQYVIPDTDTDHKTGFNVADVEEVTQQPKATKTKVMAKMIDSKPMSSPATPVGILGVVGTVGHLIGLEPMEITQIVGGLAAATMLVVAGTQAIKKYIPVSLCQKYPRYIVYGISLVLGWFAANNIPAVIDLPLDPLAKHAFATFLAIVLAISSHQSRTNKKE